MPRQVHGMSNATNTDTQKQDADGKRFAGIPEKMTRQVSKTNKWPSESKCTNCGEGNMAGSNNCEIEIKESVIKKMQADSKVRRRRALHILARGDESPR